MAMELVIERGSQSKELQTTRKSEVFSLESIQDMKKWLAKWHQ